MGHCAHPPKWFVFLVIYIRICCTTIEDNPPSPAGSAKQANTPQCIGAHATLQHHKRAKEGETPEIHAHISPLFGFLSSLHWNTVKMKLSKPPAFNAGGLNIFIWLALMFHPCCCVSQCGRGGHYGPTHIKDGAFLSTHLSSLEMWQVAWRAVAITLWVAFPEWPCLDTTLSCYSCR